MNSNYKYFNRDLSWLSFNYRVLQEAYDKKLPLYERIKFLAIYSNNLEEFYRVRVSYYRGMLRELPLDHPKRQEVRPEKIIHQINRRVSKHQQEFNDLFYNGIIPELKKEGIILVDKDVKLSSKQEYYVYQIFTHEILSYIQPVLLVKKRIKPFLKTGHTYLVMRLYTKIEIGKKIRKGKLPKYAMIKLPTDHGISRFIEIPKFRNKHYIMFLEDLILYYAGMLFPGYVIDKSFNIKVTRDADLEYEDYDEEDLIEIIENISYRRAIGMPNRFQYDQAMPINMVRFLIETFDISNTNLVQGGKSNNFRDFFNFPNPLSPELEHKKHKPLRVPDLENATSLFDKIKNKDYMLHFPYQSFDYYIQFLNEVAIDTTVKEIQTTQYRVASNSAVVDALISAALHGKKVTVFVELKARFDEENNLYYGREMQKAGIEILYGIPSTKVHAKVTLVEREGEMNDVAFLGTGNFNEKTARLYGDHGYFTSNKELLSDLRLLFKHLRNPKLKPAYKQILVPNVNLRKVFKSLINKEIKNAKEGKRGYMILKMNGLEDIDMINQLYKASEKGVKIDLLVRGACCLIPNQEYSKNIRVIRIVDKFLEHARVFMFHDNGKNHLYLGSADWMKRNLMRRIECIFPVNVEEIKQEVIDILNIQLSDNVNARIIDEKMENVKFPESEIKIRSQHKIYEYLQEKYAQKGST